nr:uncharacterized protein LOC111421996 [Onthophagus taurus]
MNNHLILIFSLTFITMIYTEMFEYDSLKRYTREIKQENCMLHLCNETNYPLKAITKLLKQKKNIKFLENFNDQLFEPYKPPNPFKFGLIWNNLCEVRQVTMYPRIGKDIQNNMKVIINVQKHRQGIIVETCIDNKKQCIEKEFLPIGLTTRCNQQYIKVRLITLSSSGTLGQDYFAIPSGCICDKRSHQ